MVNMGQKIANALRVNLNEELAKDLVEIKRYHGIGTDSDMVRFLIAKEYREITEKQEKRKDGNLPK